MSSTPASNGGPSANSLSAGGAVGRNGEPTQRFSALQQQLLCAAVHFFHRHIRSDPGVLQRMEGNHMFQLFFEVQYHNNKPDLNRIFPESVHDSSPLHVCSFILSILHQGIFSVSAFIVSVIYLSRFKESSHITLHACTWRPLFLTSLLLADKMWEDKPVRNSSLAKLFPVLSNSELNKLENRFLSEIKFNVLVKPDLFCSFCEKLLAEQVHPEISRCVSASEYAATLQADPADMVPAKPASKMPPEIARSTDVLLDNGAEKQGQALSRAKTHVPTSQGFDNNLHDGDQGRLDAGPGRLAARQGAQAAQRTASAARGGNSSPTRAWDGNSAVANNSAVPPGTGTEGLAPRSQSAGPTASSASRRGDNSAPPGGGLQGGRASDQRQAPLHALSALRGGSAARTTAPQPPRSVSVHPLHRTESTKKHPVGRAEDGVGMGGKAGNPLTATHLTGHVNSGPPTRRSLPASTSAAAHPTSGTRPGPAGMALGPRHHAQTSPRSPAGHEPPGQRPQAQTQSQGQGTSAQAAAQQAQAGRSASQPRVTTGGRHSAGTASPSTTGQQVPRVATPPVPLGHGGQPPGQVGGTVKPQQQRGVSPGGTVPIAAGGAQPARASSAPRVSGMASQPGHGNPGSQAGAAPPMQATYHSRQPGHHAQSMHVQVPGSPSLGSPMMVGGHGHGVPPVVMFPASPTTRGTSASPNTAMVGGSGMGVPMTTGRSAVGSATGLPRNASPMGIGGAPCPGMQLNNTTTRGRSPPPSAASGGAQGAACSARPQTVRAPRAGTPGALVKGIPQAAPGAPGVQRHSLGSGPMVVHRGLG